jgi:tRNA:m4X modification enzyme
LAIKHAEQQSSLLGHLDTLGMLQKNFKFIEFGAGAGEMSKYVMLATESLNKTILIDRKMIKLKLDKKLFPCERIVIDIKDLDLSKLDQVTDSKIVAYSKHLCGCATDLTLRCLNNFRNSGGY